jgi:formylglycine-generating enzyme required for sulfatase activity
LNDMHGNVWEWTQDCWNGNYFGAPASGIAWLTGDCARRIVRGGGWDDNSNRLRIAYRFSYRTAFRASSVGLRVARDN